MIEIINSSRDPYFNLALEEYALKNMSASEEYFILWQDEPTVVVGRNQNTIAEINSAYIKEKGINVVRRLSGGGAVYHDRGNLNFTFIVNEDRRSSFDFEKYTRPVIEALHRIGIEAENNGRNDITIDGRKFSGNAQFRYRGRLLHHGTILFNSSLEEMAAALNVSEEKISSKGIKSIRSRVTNIAEHLSEAMDIEEFKNILTGTIFSGEEKALSHHLSELDLDAINRLREQKYQSWEWVYGASPAFNIKKKRKFSWGNIEMRLDVKKGLIEGCKIYGDFFAARDIRELEKNFIKLPFREEIIEELLNNLELMEWLPDASKEEILELFWGQ